MNHAYLWGGAGDIIFSLAALKKMGGMWDYSIGLYEPEKFEAIKAVLVEQPFIRHVHYEPRRTDDWCPAGVTHDLNNAIHRPSRPFDDLANVPLALQFFGYYDVPMRDWNAPWLTVPPKPATGLPLGDYVAINVTARYRNPKMDWNQELRTMRQHGRLIFLGFEEEYEDFQRGILQSIQFWPTKTYLEALHIIKGAQRFTCGQSCMAAMALGAGIPFRMMPSQQNCIFGVPWQTLSCAP